MLDRNRFRGCLAGLAVGDALGTTLEFKSPGTFDPIDGMVGGGPFNLDAGQWTDDTSMALCLAESLIHSYVFDPADQMDRYVRWWQDGHLSSTGNCFDIGNTTREALQVYLDTKEPFSGPDHERSAGNGSIMRLAPVPMFFAYDPRKAIYWVGESSKTTHRHTACIDACRYMGGIIYGTLNGHTKEQLLSPGYSPTEDAWDTEPLMPEIAEVAAGSFLWKQPPDIKGSGYVVKSLEAALWAFHNSSSFREGALLAINLGDDADTTGAVYGQIAGGYYGIDGVPTEWVDKLAMRELILDYADRLYEIAEQKLTEKRLNDATSGKDQIQAWQDIVRCFGNTMDTLSNEETVEQANKRLIMRASPCSTCGTKPADLKWFFYKSPQDSWDHLAGRAGWMTACERCRCVVDFFCEMIS
ncbi:MAG: ADP-ribosylglycohydrolase family protein [Gammaproteobacteria bacterium]|nr:MAG: ADP-ribosylglycohydrolase family protein [Gammaproteobacteria bacterium]